MPLCSRRELKKSRSREGGEDIGEEPQLRKRKSAYSEATKGSVKACRAGARPYRRPVRIYLPQRFMTAFVTASRTASCRIAHWN
jgi:hypothetical protein